MFDENTTVYANLADNHVIISATLKMCTCLLIIVLHFVTVTTAAIICC